MLPPSAVWNNDITTMRRIYKDYTKKPGRVNIIKRLSTTGQAVWLYMGPTKAAARKAYQRARKKENTRVRWWSNRVKLRAAHIKSYIDQLVARLPILGDIPREQQLALRTLQRIADNPPPCDTAFYNHLQQERRKRLKQKQERDARKQLEQACVKNSR